jgi:hypothetical protein
MFLNRLFCLGDTVVKLFPIGILTLTTQKSGMFPVGIRQLLWNIHSHDHSPESARPNIHPGGG